MLTRKRAGLRVSKRIAPKSKKSLLHCRKRRKVLRWPCWRPSTTSQKRPTYGREKETVCVPASFSSSRKRFCPSWSYNRSQRGSSPSTCTCTCSEVGFGLICTLQLGFFFYKFSRRLIGQLSHSACFPLYLLRQGITLHG